MAQGIDPRLVKWDEAPKINASMVKWEEKPRAIGDALPNIGFGEGVLSLASGAIAAPAAGLAGLAAAANPFFKPGVGADTVKAVQEAMTYRPRSEVGQTVVNTVSAPFEWLAGKADQAGGAVTDATGSPALGAAANTAIQMAPAAIGGVPGLLKSPAKSGAQSLMQSAIKPTIKDLHTGKAAAAIDTLLAEGVNPTPAGIGQLRGRIMQLNSEIQNSIQNSTAIVDKAAVYKPVQEALGKFSKQVTPQADLATIRAAWDEFQSHPLAPGDTMPVQLAQELKQGTYRTLDKKYGQLGTAETEAQKAIARGLKDEISNVVPGVAALNARESALINAMDVAERRALMEINKNPMGLALLAKNPQAWAAFMADRSAAFKSVIAQMLNSTSQGLPSVGAGAAGGVLGVTAGQQ